MPAGVHAATRSNTFLGGAEVCEPATNAPCIGAARRAPGAAAGGPAARRRRPANFSLLSAMRYLPSSWSSKNILKIVYSTSLVSQHRLVLLCTLYSQVTLFLIVTRRGERNIENPKANGPSWQLAQPNRQPRACVQRTSRGAAARVWEARTSNCEPTNVDPSLPRSTLTFSDLASRLVHSAHTRTRRSRRACGPAARQQASHSSHERPREATRS